LESILDENTASNKGIHLEKVSFQYEGPESHLVLNNINLSLPEGKVTAIVGESGSGKSTLLKLLLKFYEPTSGRIILNDHDFAQISPGQWRGQCGAVMQDGYLFSESIERNIVMGSEIIDNQRLANAVEMSNVNAFVDTMPLRLKTKVGLDGNSISGGQRQRILIARVIYKNPRYLFLDEATSALDAENERIIHGNLQKFLHNKTAVIIAHRLSTVKQADNIIVLKNGSVVEQGKHNDLVNAKSYYYELVKNQLELGN
jgi:ATP-binding cassette subfamily B protein